MNLTTFLYNNNIQYLSTSIEFNDLIRRIENPASTDLATRYNINDPFFAHVEDDGIFNKKRPDYLYPYVGIDFTSYNAPEITCGIEINTTYSIILGHCTPENGQFQGFETGQCSISITNVRERVEEILNFLINMYSLTIVDGITGNITDSNLFHELQCTDQQMWDCDTEQWNTEPWEYNVWGKLRRDPIISPIKIREDGIFECHLTVPLRIERILTDCDCV